MASWVDTLEMSNRLAEQADQRDADAERQQRAGQRQQRGQQRPAEHDQQDGQRGRDADAERPAQAGPLGVADGRAAQRDVHVGAVGGLGCADQAPGVGRGHLSQGPVPGHAGEGHGAGPADLRGPGRAVGAGHALHPGHGGGPGQRRGDRGPDRGGPDGRPVGGLDHHLVALARHRREVRGQQGSRRLRVGIRQAEVGVEAGAGGRANAGHRDQDQQPAGQHPPAMCVTPASQTRHGSDLRVLRLARPSRPEPHGCGEPPLAS